MGKDVRKSICKQCLGGVLTCVLLLGSIPITSAFGLESEEEKRTVLTYNDTGVEELRLNAVAEEVWEKGFQNFEVWSNEEGYENPLEAFERNSMVYVSSAETSDVPVAVLEESASTISLEQYNGDGGEYYLWRYCTAEQKIENISAEELTDGLDSQRYNQEDMTNGFWVRAEVPIGLQKWETEKEVNPDLTKNEEVAEEQVTKEEVEALEEEKKSTYAMEKKNTYVINELERIFEPEFQFSVGENNVNPYISGNLISFYNPKTGGGVPGPGIWTDSSSSYAFGINLKTFPKKKVSLKSNWTVRAKFTTGTIPAKSRKIIQLLIFDPNNTSLAGGTLEQGNTYANRHGSWFGANNEQERSGWKYQKLNDNVEYFKNGAIVLFRYSYNEAKNKGVLSIVDEASGYSYSSTEFTPTDLGCLRLGGQVFWGYGSQTTAAYNSYPMGPVDIEFLGFSYDEYMPQIVSYQWYKVEEGVENKIDENTLVQERDLLRVKIVAKNATAQYTQIPMRFKLSDDTEQAITQNIDIAGSGLEGDGTETILTNAEQTFVFDVKAASSNVGEPAVLGLMMQDDFFEEKYYMQLSTGTIPIPTPYTITYVQNLPEGSTIVTSSIPEKAVVAAGMSIALPSSVVAETTTHRYTLLGWKLDNTGDLLTGDYEPTADVTMHAVWSEPEPIIYTITYNQNLPEGAVIISGTIPETEAVMAGQPVMLPSNAVALAGTKSYALQGWLLDGTEEVLTGKYTPMKDVIISAVWREIDHICPYTLDLATRIVKDGNGNTVADGSDSDLTDGASFDKATSVLTISGYNLFSKCSESHTHTLIITGEDKTINLSLEGYSSNITRFNAVIKDVRARGVYLGYLNSLTFEGVNEFGGKAEDTKSEYFKEGISWNFGAQFGYKIKDNASVVVYSDRDGNTFAPIRDSSNDIKENVGLNGNNIHALLLSMESVSSTDNDLYVIGNSNGDSGNVKKVTIPAGMKQIAMLDNLNGNWLTGQIEIKDNNAASANSYVYGLEQDNTSTEESDTRYDFNNVYGKNFALDASGLDSNAGIGRYYAVRLPKKIRQLNISVPTRIVFNIYTNGADNKNGDHGFIAPEYQLKNQSYIVEDSFSYSEGEITKTLEFGKTYESVDISYLGITESKEKNSQYILRGYGSIGQTQMSEIVEENPIVCLEAEGCGVTTDRITLDSKQNHINPQSWFTANAASGEGTSSVGISRLQLKVPQAYIEATIEESKRWYQEPKQVVEEDMVLRGYHTIKLNFLLK